MMRAAACIAAWIPILIAADSALPPFPLKDIVDKARVTASTTSLLNATGLKRDAYLPIIHGIVSYFRNHQRPDGSIIDPYAGIEIQYSTPTYAFASSVMVTSGYDVDFLNSSAKALDCALRDLSIGDCPQRHCNFFTLPCMLAYEALKPLVTPQRAATWEALLRAVEPDKAYKGLMSNWGLVAVGGEYLRTSVHGFGDPKWWQDLLTKQLEEGRFTANGQYQDHSGLSGRNPLPYDAYACKYLTVAAARGYNSSVMRELLRRSSFSQLLIQSPWGEVPTGGRSSQHQWNEAVAAVIYEIQSNWAREAGDAQAACMFKRAARLSLHSVARWQTSNGALQVVKNHFDPQVRWGYEYYSFISNFNLIAASPLAMAYSFADPNDTVAECTTFADAGGFALHLPEFNHVVANARGTYVTIDIGADPHYDSTGLHRVHINTCGTVAAGDCVLLDPLLGPSNGPPQERGGLTAGVFWATGNDTTSGDLVRLSNHSFMSVTRATFSHSFTNSRDSVYFSIQYVILGPGIVATESYSLKPGQVRVRAQVGHQASAGSRITRFGVTFPAFVFDGRTNMSVTVPTRPVSTGASTAVVAPQGVTAMEARRWGTQTFTVLPPAAGRVHSWSYDPDATVNTLNGVLTPISCEVSPITNDSPAIEYVIGPLRNGKPPVS